MQPIRSSGLIALAFVAVRAPGAFGKRCVLVLAALASCVVATEAYAQSASPSDARALGLSLAGDGRCEAALEVLLPLRVEPAADAELERRVGECAIRLERYELALGALGAARGLDPEATGLDLHLAQAAYHLGRLDEAEVALQRAAGRPDDGAASPNTPEWLLYAGLVAFDRGDSEQAVERLSAAVALRDDAIEPMASFYLGRAQQRLRDAGQARESFGRVLEGYSDTAWADQAARSIAALDAEAAMPVWASLELGFEADDNALLRGRGVGRPGEISGDSDVRGYWFADAGALWLRAGELTSGATLRYGGSENDEFERFDTHAPGVTLWLDRAVGPRRSTLRMQYDFDVAWVDTEKISNDPFVVSHLWSAAWIQPWSSGVTTLAGSVSLDDYLYRRNRLRVPDLSDPGACEPCSPDGVDEIGATNRDGFGPIVSLVHRQGLPAPAVPGVELPWIEGGYRYQLQVSQGREYDHQRHQFELAAGIRLPLAVELSLRGRYAYLPYAHRSVFPDPSEVPDVADTAYFLDPSARREHETQVRVQLQRAWGQHVLVAARWTRTRNRSTADVFDYTRNLFGLSVRIAWGG